MSTTLCYHTQFHCHGCPMSGHRILYPDQIASNFMIECWKMLVGHLAVWGWLLLVPATSSILSANTTHNNATSITSTSTGNHVCHRTNTVEVRVAVPLQEPATFRSYTWCLKVPPRCSKYTVVMRERITYETEVRNHTVSECCPGYVSLYGECVSACKTCVNMHCKETRNCTCASGFIGPQCNQTCAAGKWGDRCQETCVCRVGEDCNPTTGSCSPSTSTVAPSTAPTTSSSTIRHVSPSTSTHSPTKIPLTTTTSNVFVDLSLTEPTTSSEDLTDFNILIRPRTNDSVKHVNNEVNNINALGDLDYPVLPTDSAVESFNYIQADHDPNKHVIVNNLNNSVVNDRWISELSAHSGVTLGTALSLFVLLAVTIVAVVRCRNNKMAQHTVPPVEKSSLHLVAKNSHYAVPGPPSFSFINGQLEFSREMLEESYDHPRSVRCLTSNEPIYDELRY